MQEHSIFRPPKGGKALLLLPALLLVLQLLLLCGSTASAASVANAASAGSVASTASGSPVPSAPATGGSGGPTSPVDQWVKGQVEHLPKDKVESYWDQLMKDYGGFFPEGRTPSLMDMLLPGDKGLSFKSVLSGLMNFMWHEVLYNGKLLVTIVMISVLSMILETLPDRF